VAAKILIADDAKFIRVILKNILQENNYDIAGEAADGRQAVEMYKELEPDIVILDITMPVMNGVEAVEKIRKYDESARIILCTAKGQKQMIKKALKKGARDYIVKPFEEERLLKTITRNLG